jgi:GNAT superfamily N-acetyltransferase
MPRDLALRKRLKIREASPEDIDKIHDEKLFKDIYKPDIEKGLFSIHLDGKMIGWGQMNSMGWEGEISRIEILPEFRGKGIGRKAIGFFNAVLIKRKVKEIVTYHTKKSSSFYDHATNLKPTGYMNERRAYFHKKRK